MEYELAMKKNISEIVRQLKKNKFRLMSKRGKNLGTFSSRKAAEKHEREVQFFKHKK